MEFSKRLTMLKTKYLLVVLLYCFMSSTVTLASFSFTHKKVKSYFLKHTLKNENTNKYAYICLDFHLRSI